MKLEIKHGGHMRNALERIGLKPNSVTMRVNSGDCLVDFHEAVQWQGVPLASEIIAQILAGIDGVTIIDGQDTIAEYRRDIPGAALNVATWITIKPDPVVTIFQPERKEPETALRIGPPDAEPAPDQTETRKDLWLPDKQYASLWRIPAERLSKQGIPA